MASNQKESLNEQRPHVPLYDQLPAPQQKAVFKEGEKVFKDQIKAQEDTLMNEMKDKLNPENYLGSLKSIVPTSSLDGLLEGAKSKFASITKLLQGGGGFADIAKGIF